MLCTTIRLLFLGSAGSIRPPWAVSTPGSFRSGNCLAFVIHSMKHLSASVGRGLWRGWSAVDGVCGGHDCRSPEVVALNYAG
jgi:hypothetical protein